MASIRKFRGKWQVQVRRKGFPSISRTFERKTDAQEWARQTERQADRRDLPTDTSILDRTSLADILSRYLEEITPQKRSGASEPHIITRLKTESIARQKLSELTPAHFKKLIQKRLKDVKPSTIKRELAIVRHALNVAKDEWEYPLPSNPLSSVKMPEINDARDRRLHPGELETLEDASHVCRNPYAWPIIEFALETAMRRSEILRIQWTDIQWNSRTLFIPVTKNGSPRTIPLTKRAMEILKARLKRKGKGPFPITTDAFQMAWKRLIHRSKIKDLRFHDFRHEAISRFFEQGLSIPEVALISGHKDPRMLFRYTHLRAEDLVQKLK